RLDSSACSPHSQLWSRSNRPMRASGINPVRRPIIPKQTRIMGLVRAFACTRTMWSWAAAGPTRKPLLRHLLDLLGHGLRQLLGVTDDLIDLLAGRRAGRAVLAPLSPQRNFTPTLVCYPMHRSSRPENAVTKELEASVEIVRNVFGGCLLGQSLRGQPKRRLHMPLAGTPSDQNQRGKIAHR